MMHAVCSSTTCLKYADVQLKNVHRLHQVCVRLKCMDMWLNQTGNSHTTLAKPSLTLSGKCAKTRRTIINYTVVALFAVAPWDVHIVGQYESCVHHVLGGLFWSECKEPPVYAHIRLRRSWYKFHSGRFRISLKDQSWNLWCLAAILTFEADKLAFNTLFIFMYVFIDDYFCCYFVSSSSSFTHYVFIIINIYFNRCLSPCLAELFSSLWLQETKRNICLICCMYCCLLMKGSWSKKVVHEHTQTHICTLSHTHTHANSWPNCSVSLN